MYPEIQKLLLNNDMTYADLGEILGISNQAVYRRMNNQTKWSVTEAAKICAYFKVWDIDTLFRVSN